MKITSFKSLIQQMPFQYQAFDIRYDIWKDTSQRMVDDIFKNRNGKGSITISRGELLLENGNIEEHILKILMWGYPTKGRGKNIDEFMKPENFGPFIANLKALERQPAISTNDIERMLRQTKGLGFSTLSKILYFRKIMIQSYKALILDRRVINALNSGRFEDSGIEVFQKLRYDNATMYYPKYLEFAHSLARQMDTEADRVEMFLFEYGLNLKR